MNLKEIFCRMTFATLMAACTFLHFTCNDSWEDMDIESLKDFVAIDSFVVPHANKQESIYSTYSYTSYPYFYFLHEQGDKISTVDFEKKSITTVDLSTLLLKHKIQQINNFYVDTSGFVYIFPFNSYAAFKINFKGEIMEEIAVEGLSKNLTLANTYSNPIHRYKDALLLGVQNNMYNDYFAKRSHRIGFFNEALTIFFVKNGNSFESQKRLGRFPNFFKIDSSYYDWYINSTMDSNNVTYCFSNIDSIYHFNIESGEARASSIGNSFHKPNKAVKAMDLSYNQIRQYYVESSFYNDLQYDKFHNRYLLYYSQGIKYLKNELENHQYGDKPRLLILHSEKLGNKYVRVDNAFIIETLSVHRRGIAIAKRVQDGLKFYVYEI